MQVAGPEHSCTHKSRIMRRTAAGNPSIVKTMGERNGRAETFHGK
jgi:hypothetical protein